MGEAVFGLFLPLKENVGMFILNVGTYISFFGLSFNFSLSFILVLNPTFPCWNIFIFVPQLAVTNFPKFNVYLSSLRSRVAKTV
jgi:hypothetical protein